MSLAQLNGTHSGEPVQEQAGIPDPHFVPGNTVFGNRYPRAFKLKVLEETDACTKSGVLGKYLRQHGLTHATLTCFRKQRASGALEATPRTSRTSPKRAAAKNVESKEQAKKLMELERENRKLRRQLEQAEVIIDIQKKVARLLDIQLEEPSARRRNRSTGSTGSTGSANG